MPTLHITRRRFGAVLGATLTITAAPVAAQDRPVVAVDNYPLAYFGERLAGDMADVLFLVPADVDPSFWRPGIAEITAIQGADLIALNGAGFATWTTRTTLPRSRTVDTSADFADAYIATETITHSHGGDGEHSHTGTASYTWLDFDQATLQAEALARVLERVLPETGSSIEAPLVALSADLAALDTLAQDTGSLAAGLPIIASHPRYQYFARAYGLELSAVEWDAREPATEAQWQALEGLVSETGARLFIWEAEPLADARARMDSLGLISVVFPPLANRPEAGDFVGVMEASLARLRVAVEEAAAM